MDPVNSSTLYFGTFRVWKTENKGNNWMAVSSDLTKGGSNYFHTITTIAVSHVNNSFVVAGTADGKVHISENAGFTWSDRTAGLPDRWITRVATDPFDANTIYATLSGFRWDEPLPHVFKSTDLGLTWIDISGNLPEFPVNDIVLDPIIEGRIIVGTDAGMYGTYNSGQSWFWIWTDLPAVPVCAIKVHPGERKIVAGTYGLSTFTASLDDIFTGIQTGHARNNLKITVSPNPLDQSSHLKFYLPESDVVSVRLFNATGREITSLYEGELGRGNHRIPLSGLSSFSSGIYFLSLESQKSNGTCKVIKY
jgi:hypothetical protein